jgi:hypothetical protein
LYDINHSMNEMTSYDTILSVMSPDKILEDTGQSGELGIRPSRRTAGLYLLNSIRTFPSEPLALAKTVGERGNKARSVTCSSHGATTLGDPLRKSLFRMLERDPIVNDSMKGNH